MLSFLTLPVTLSQDIREAANAVSCLILLQPYLAVAALLPRKYTFVMTRFPSLIGRGRDTHRECNARKEDEVS